MVVVVGVLVEVVVEVVAVVIVEGGLEVVDVMAVVTIASHQAVLSNSEHVAFSIVMQQWP